MKENIPSFIFLTKKKIKVTHTLPKKVDACKYFCIALKNAVESTAEMTWNI